MNVLIDIVLAGLMVLVPNSSDDPSSMTVYLLDDARHKPVIRILGVIGELAALPQGIPDPFSCKRTDYSFGGVGGAEVVCNLVDAEIFIAPELERRQQHLRHRPREKRPVSASEKESLEWIVRMSNIQGGTGRVETPANLKSKVAARFTFGWREEKTCALDGSEYGEAKLIGFQSATKTSNLRQAVAESILFSAEIRPGPIAITLRNSKGFERIIRASCARDRCLAIAIDNSLRKQHRPHAQEHFSRYYELSRVDGEKMVPFVLSPTITKEEGTKFISSSLLGCNLRLLQPVSPVLAEKVREAFKEELSKGKDIALSDLELLFSQLFVANQAMSAPSIDAEYRKRSIVDVFFDLFQVQDRIICPPARLEP